MNSDDVIYSEVDISKRVPGRPTSTPFAMENLVPLCPNGKTTSCPKLDNIKSIPYLIPKDPKPFYNNLFDDQKIIDDVDGYDGALQLSIFLQKSTGNFEIMLDGISLVLMGRIVLSENTKTEFNKSVAVSYENTHDLTSNEVYNEMENRGYQYQDHFRGILNAQVGDQGCISTIKWRNNWCSFIDSLIQVVLLIEGESSQDIYLPVEIQQVVIHPSLHAEPQDYKVVYQKVTGIIRGGGVEMLGLKTSHVDIFKNNEACVKLESFKFVSHSNPRLQVKIRLKFS
uniref:Polyketide synthase dehydratase domain-containing protein n=1 Tax=Timema douglasi TaxID=61478 RepID=A0A7R8VWZ3_TIMDO|nr:unnamed protein product [Timema douglasi]